MGDESVPQSNSRRLPWDTSSKGHQHAGPTEPGGVRDVAEGSLYAGAIWIPGGPATQICPAHTQDVFKVVPTTRSSARVHPPGEAFHLPAISARHVYHPGKAQHRGTISSSDQLCRPEPICRGPPPRCVLAILILSHRIYFKQQSRPTKQGFLFHYTQSRERGKRAGGLSSEE